MVQTVKRNRKPLPLFILQQSSNYTFGTNPGIGTIL
jgi:hypothetical protein